MAGEFDIPLGLCQCGCGGKTPLAQRSNPDRGVVRGQPCRFIRGHGTKGLQQSPEVIARRAENHPGKCKPGCTCGHHTEEARKRVGDASRGRKLSEATKKKISLANQLRWDAMSDDDKEVIASKHRGQRRSDETKHQMSESARLRFERMSEEERQQFRLHCARMQAKQGVHQPSKLELAVREVLDRVGVVWRANEIIDRFHPDLILSDLDIALEVHGCYWHGCPICYPNRVDCVAAVRDQVKVDVFAEHGLKYVAIWEHEINADVASAVNRAVYG